MVSLHCLLADCYRVLGILLLRFGLRLKGHLLGRIPVHLRFERSTIGARLGSSNAIEVLLQTLRLVLAPEVTRLIPAN